ncbi:RimK family alpha-L-glutamate ligase [Candidatus Bathyarchaeota archaeon]|nr:RimK family alpha-L-glutamate ligase [Candidatus Bathyarchaeota archaeon]
MKVGLMTRDQDAWCSSRLKEAFVRKSVEPVAFRFSDVAARIGSTPKFSLGEIDILSSLSAILVRPIGRGSLDEIIFQMDGLHKLAREGMPIINPPAAIERAVDKYYTLALLNERGIPVPRTVVTENIREAMQAFRSFGGDAVIKPVFGSRGIGVARISDEDIAERVMRTLRFYKHVLYVQEFIGHGTRDIRTFVVGGKVVAGIFRVSSSWKTNVSRGAVPKRFQVDPEVEALAVRASETLDCKIAGVDIMESERGLVVHEVNSQPGWRGLQMTTDVRIADEIAAFVIAQAKK